MNIFRTSIGFVLACLLAACGGASSDANSPPGSNALNGAYKVLTAVGSALTVAVDLDAKTLSYSTNGVTVSGNLAQSGDEWILLTPSNKVTSTRLVIKDGFFFGALPDWDSTNNFVAATAAGARGDLLIRDASQFAGRYYSLPFHPCLSTASTCISDAYYPSQLALDAVAGSTSKVTATSCADVFSTSTPLKTWLNANPKTGGCTSYLTTISRNWTVDAEGMVSASAETTSSNFNVMFAKVNGKITGFSTNGIIGGASTVGYGMRLILPIVANTPQSYVGPGLAGLMNRATKTFIQGDYGSTSGDLGTLTSETGKGSFTIQSEAIATGVASVNNDMHVALFTDGRFGAWFSSFGPPTGGRSITIIKFK